MQKARIMIGNIYIVFTVHLPFTKWCNLKTCFVVSLHFCYNWKSSLCAGLHKKVLFIEWSLVKSQHTKPIFCKNTQSNVMKIVLLAALLGFDVLIIWLFKIFLIIYKAKEKKPCSTGEEIPKSGRLVCTIFFFFFIFFLQNYPKKSLKIMIFYLVIWCVLHMQCIKVHMKYRSSCTYYTIC